MQSVLPELQQRPPGSSPTQHCSGSSGKTPLELPPCDCSRCLLIEQPAKESGMIELSNSFQTHPHARMYKTSETADLVHALCAEANQPRQGGRGKPRDNSKEWPHLMHICIPRDI